MLLTVEWSFVFSVRFSPCIWWIRREKHSIPIQTTDNQDEKQAISEQKARALSQALSAHALCLNAWLPRLNECWRKSKWNVSVRKKYGEKRPKTAKDHLIVRIKLCSTILYFSNRFCLRSIQNDFGNELTVWQGCAKRHDNQRHPI